MRSFLASICLCVVLLLVCGCGGSGGGSSHRTAIVLSNPGSIRRIDLSDGSTIGSAVPLTGNLRNIAYNDIDGKIYAIGTDMNLYTVNVVTGACTLISAAPMALSSYNGGMTFVPATNTILFVNQNDDYYKINALTGAVISQQADANISVFGLTYRPSDGDFYAYSQNDTIHKAADLPTSGTFTSVGALGIDLSGGLGFAVDPTSGFGYIVCQDGLYLVNLDTGAGTPINVTSTGEDIVILP